MTTLTPAASVTGIEKWLLSAMSIILAMASLIYATSKDSSLAIVASKSPSLAHFSAAFATTLTIGFLVWLRTTFVDSRYDVLLGCIVLILALAWTIINGFIFVLEYLKLSSAQAFDASLARVRRIDGKYLDQAYSAASARAEAERAAGEFGLAFQALNQIARTGIEGTSYLKSINDLSDVADRLATHLTGLRVAGTLNYEDYKLTLQTIVRESAKHILSLTDTFHECEAQKAASICVKLLEHALVQADHPDCFKDCMLPVQDMLLACEKRGSRETVTTVLTELDRMRAETPATRGSTVYLLQVYLSVLTEAVLKGDSAVINEVLYKVILAAPAEDQCIGDIVRWAYTQIWYALIKGIEHSAYRGTEASLKTFTSRFDQRVAHNTLGAILKVYGELGSILCDVEFADRESQPAESLDSQITFIKQSLDYCLQKLTILWCGQQAFMVKSGDSKTGVTFYPGGVYRENHLSYLQSWIPNSGYSLPWTSDPEIMDRVVAELRQCTEIRSDS